MAMTAVIYVELEIEMNGLVSIERKRNSTRTSIEAESCFWISWFGLVPKLPYLYGLIDYSCVLFIGFRFDIVNTEFYRFADRHETTTWKSLVN